MSLSNQHDHCLALQLHFVYSPCLKVTYCMQPTCAPQVR